MSVTAAPVAMAPTAQVPCVICLIDISLHEVTAGALYADGSQAFACTSHMRDRSRWIVSWLAFVAAQSEPATARVRIGR
ncbi:MAG TPA: hypothetical protein VD735_06790 [Candidatus Saccharimonadales bacterium]|nr:hypothetical protein [Candidatus Saccharimonadales bacterium]